MIRYVLFTAVTMIGCGGEPFSMEAQQTNVYDPANNYEVVGSENRINVDEVDAGDFKGSYSVHDGGEGVIDAGNDSSDSSNADSSFEDAPIDTGLDSEGDTGLDSEADSGVCSNNLQNDPLNCGYCGHSCEGGECNNGECKEFSVAFAQSPGDIVGYNDNIYWIHSGGVSSQPKGGSQVSQVFVFNGETGSMTVQNGSLYFTSPYSNSIYKYDGVVEEVAFGVTNIHSLGVDNAYLYAVEYYSNNNPNNSILRVSLGSGLVERLVSPSSPRHIAVGTDKLYFGDLSYGAVMFMNKTGSGYVILSEGNHPRKLVFHEDYVYWANGSPPNRGVYKIEKTGAGNEVKLADANNAWGVYIHGQYVYWTDNAGGTVNRVHVNGGTNEVIVENQNGPHSVYADDHAVYWANRDNNSVMKKVM